MESIDRTVLPMPDPEFKGKITRTLKDSKDDWAMLAPVRPPLGAPNVLLVLIDDAGFGNPETFGGPVETPNLTRVADAGLRYNRFHVTAVCSPTRAATLTGRNHHSVGFGSLGELPGPVPRIHGPAAQELRARREDAAAERLRHLGLRQVAPDPRQRAGPGGPLRPLAERVGLRLLLGLPRRRGGPVRPRDHREQHRDRRARGQGLLLPGRDGRQGDRVAARGARAGRAEAVLHVLLDRKLPRASSRPQALGRQVRGPLRRGLGPLPRVDVRAPEEARRHPRGHGAHAPERRDAGLGLADGRAEEALRPADGGLRGLPGERRLQRRPACSTRWRSWASSTTRS